MNRNEPKMDDLIAALRAERPEPRPEFTADLDARAAEGFPRGGAAGDADRALDRVRRAITRLPAGWPRLAPALGTAAALVIGIGIAISQPELGGQGRNDDGGGSPPVALEQPGTAPGPARSAAEPAGPVELSQKSTEPQAGSSAGTDSSAPSDFIAPPPPSGERITPGRDRKVERSAQLTLATSADHVEETADEVFRVVDRHRGIVRSSSVTGGADTGVAGAQFDLLIPGAELQATVADLSELAHVRSRTEGTLDVTTPFVTARERLAEARAERESLLRRLEAATTANEAEAIRARLRTAGERIASARREMSSISRRVRFSPLYLSIVGDGSAPAEEWGLGEAWDDALNVLAVMAGAALVGLAASVPIALLIAACWLAYAAVRRRRRDRALDGPYST